MANTYLTQWNILSISKYNAGREDRIFIAGNLEMGKDLFEAANVTGRPMQRYFTAYCFSKGTV